MDYSAIEIIVPVWNNPEDTRNCLASLVECSPGARLILMDNGSNKETETLLQTFAEGLHERALLLRSEKTHSYVRVVNRGLARAEAAASVVVKNTTIVSQGWLQPILECVDGRSDIGVAVPNLVAKMGRILSNKKFLVRPPIEISHGSFAAIVVMKRLYDRIGGFDENLDGRLWCLKDYSRRAWQEGFLTVSAAGAPVYCKEDVLLGSLTRRAEMEQKSFDLFTERWGEERAYCVQLTGEPCSVSIGRTFAVMLNEARLGHSFTILAHPKAYRAIVSGGYNLVHKNIVVEQLPIFFAAHAAQKHISRLSEKNPHIRVLAESEDVLALEMNEEGLPEAEIID